MFSGTMRGREHASNSVDVMEFRRYYLTVPRAWLSTAVRCVILPCLIDWISSVRLSRRIPRQTVLSA